MYSSHNFELEVKLWKYLMCNFYNILIWKLQLCLILGVRGLNYMPNMNRISSQIRWEHPEWVVNWKTKTIFNMTIIHSFWFCVLNLPFDKMLHVWRESSPCVVSGDSKRRGGKTINKCWYIQLQIPSGSYIYPNTLNLDIFKLLRISSTKCL